MQRTNYGSWVELMRLRAVDTPTREALTFLLDGESEQVTWDYRTLDARARTIAAALQHQPNCAAGERAVLLYPPGPEFVAAFLGCLYAGVIAVPAYPPRSAEHERALPRLSGILRDSAPAVVLTSGAKMLAVVRECVVAAGVSPSVCLDTIELADSLSEGWRDPANLDPNTVAFLQYTSGSTSAPKGVVVTHGNLLHNSASIQDAFGHTENSRGVIWLPPYHDMGLIGGILQPLYAGFPVTLMAPAAMLQKPLRWLKAVSDFRGTTSGGPDFAFDLAARSIKPDDRAALDLSNWEVAYTGAEPVRKDTIDRFVEAFEPCGFRREAFYPCYGLAESTLFVTGGSRLNGATSRRVDSDALRDNRVASATDDRAQQIVGCGETYGDTELKIVDPQTRVPCNPNQIGEIWIRGGSVAHGYWQRPDATAETFAAHTAGDDYTTWLRTGDLGFFADAHLYITGRIKDLIIVRGRNHYPNDIEHTAASAHSALRPGGGAAFSVDVDGAERLVIVHEVERTQRDADPTEIFNAIREAVTTAHELPPHAIILLKPGRLPRTSSGKVRRHACREAFVTNTDLGELVRWNAPAVTLQLQPQPAEPVGGSELEAWLLDKLAAALGVPVGEIDAGEPFARYGLDSANAVALSAQIGADLGLDLEATLFWDYPSVKSLAAYLGETRAPDGPPANKAA